MPVSYENYLHNDPMDDPCKPEDESFSPHQPPKPYYRKTMPDPEGIEYGC